jgi:hypothetical protein
MESEIDDDRIKVVAGEIVKIEIKDCHDGCLKDMSALSNDIEKVEKEVGGVQKNMAALIKLNATLLVGIIVTLVAVLLK